MNWRAAALTSSLGLLLLCAPAGAVAGPKPAFERTPGQVLARPSDSQPDPAGTHKWSGPEAGGSPVCGPHFCVHWTAAGIDASTQAYAQQLDGILENDVYPCENGTSQTACAGAPGQGWRAAASDGVLGGNSETDVYIQDLYSTEHVFGYTAVDPGQSSSPAIPHSAYMVMDRDYTRYGDGSAASGLAAEQVTAAHEYNHVLQNAYDYHEQPWMFESTAVYMEEKAYPSNNDYIHYVTSWANSTAQPLTTFSLTNLKAYGSAVWNHWLDHRYGSGVVRKAWEQSVGAADFAPAAYGAAITALGGAGFSDEFDRFSAAVAEWNVPGSGFPDHYVDVPRNGSLPVGSQTQPFGLAHTTFALFNVPVPGDAPPTIRLTATLPAGTAGALALVGRTGTDPNAGTVTSNLTPITAGGIAGVQLDQPARFGRITAVVVDSDPSHGAFNTQLGDYAFTNDAASVVAAVAEPGSPIPTTGSATDITDHTATLEANVDPHLNDTTWSIQYGRTSTYGRSTQSASLPAATVGAAPVAAPLTGLRADTTYHYRVVASNGAGSSTGGDLAFTTAQDVTPPVVQLVVRRQKFAATRKRGVAYLMRCDERCVGGARLFLRPSDARKLGLPVVIGRAHVALAPRSNFTQLRVSLAAPVRRRLAVRPRQLLVGLQLTVADASHNSARVIRALTLVR